MAAQWSDYQISHLWTVPIKPIKSPPAALQLYPARLQLPQLLFPAILLHKGPDGYTVPELIGCFVSEDIAIKWVHCPQCPGTECTGGAVSTVHCVQVLEVHWRCFMGEDTAVAVTDLCLSSAPVSSAFF